MKCNRLGAAVLAGAMCLSLELGPGLLAAEQQSKPATAAQPQNNPAPVNLNAATAADLEKLPGVGAAMAARILEYRQKSGGFKKVEELMNVQGIGERNFLRLKPLVTVTPPAASDR
jgi:competence protein ComEA